MGLVNRSYALLSIAKAYAPTNPVAAGTVATVASWSQAQNSPNYCFVAMTGTTAQRPVLGVDNDVMAAPQLPAGFHYLDTTLGYLVVWDGASWRNPATGAAV